MKITSCDGCGVVLDCEKLNMPNIVNQDGTIDTDHAEWMGDDFVAFTPCPNCSARIYDL